MFQGFFYISSSFRVWVE